MTESVVSTRPFEGLQIPVAGTYALDAAHKRVGFVARHLMVSKVRGQFAEASATITIGEDPLQSGVTASINTGITEPVELVVEFEGATTSPYGKGVFGFSAHTEIDREDWGLTWNMALESGGVMVGKKIKIEIEGEAVRQDA